MAELRNIKWSKLIKDLGSKESLGALIKSRSLQWALTTAMRKQGYLLIDDLDNLVLEYKGVKFYSDLINYPRMFEAWNRYDIESVRPGDKVLDIGANIGSFTLPCALRGATVTAVEPLFGDTLVSNAKLNNIYISVRHVGVGLSHRGVVDCQEYRKSVDLIPPHSLEGRWDVVRLDCGGEESNCLITLNGTRGFWGRPRQLEVEFHFLTERQREKWEGEFLVWKAWKNFLIGKGYGYLARWSKHRHWMYLSASLEKKDRKEVQLIDGSFRGRNLELWKGLV